MADMRKGVKLHHSSRVSRQILNNLPNASVKCTTEMTFARNNQARPFTMAEISNDELSDIYAFAVQLGKDAGAMLTAAAQSRFGNAAQATGLAFEEKENSVDIVTQTDEGRSSWPRSGDPLASGIRLMATQTWRLLSRAPLPTSTPNTSAFVHTFRCRYPILMRARFLGEETYSKGASRDYLIDDSPTWCVDPLDGTVNYTHLFPMFCVSIGFIVGGRPLLGL